ncbi:hypothetical protein LTR91_005910 [Friedmanniomyces endolithicus]|uniref:Major facilitator superfamily (MFS) profile domain-containing protein n=1 Tax=Friedmanniomyces endolithicus TaxID=329885 RepID=A0AAN6QXC8_9PEZI|nr:hypothetical protein LTR94_012140 [Friedmanniomyces endolithicus]KAK0808648.1 hypothetical protein LTR59_002801 [Friedmanniomyces endolithicus]KAK0813119.1 hypothetical protein LTR38_003194 [Friedmanniomyces endolithicus]KAK0820063.1 hypothetical protein LTR75_001833 [Friedmanniomyces endolithicus]KAK0824950.1 hypothetical protein LTR03_017581 [Friedmanniomyces endolithicus]
MSGLDTEVKEKPAFTSPATSTPDDTQASIAEGQITGEDDDDDEVVVGWRAWMAAISGSSCVYSGYYMGLLLGNTAGFIVKDLGGAEVEGWIPNEYTIITAAIAGLTAGCADHVGRKNVLIGGITVAFVGSVVIAAAQNMASVLVGAAMQAGLFINQGNFFSIPAEVLPRRYRGLGQTVAVSAGALGVLIGFNFSGKTIENDTGGLSWRSTYIMGACNHLLAIVLLFFFYRPLQISGESHASHMEFLRKGVDWLGAFLLAAGMGLFLLGLTLGSTGVSWSSGKVLGTLCGGAAGFLALAIHQIFINKHGILDHDLWTRNFCVASFGCFVEGFVYYAILLFFQQETATLWESRPYLINVRMLAFFVTSGVVAPCVGWYTRRTKDLKYPLIGGWLLVLIGFIILTTATESSNYTSIGGLFIAGFGFSVPLALLFAVAQLATPRHLLGLTTGQLIAARGAGQTVGAAVLAAVYNAKVEVVLPDEVSTAALNAGLPLSSVPAFLTALTSGNATALSSIPGATSAIIEVASAAAKHAYVESFHYGWYTALPFAIIALLSVFLLDGKKIKAQMTWLVERPVAPTVHRGHLDVEHAAGSRRASILSTERRTSFNAKAS